MSGRLRCLVMILGGELQLLAATNQAFSQVAGLFFGAGVFMIVAGVVGLLFADAKHMRAGFFAGVCE